LPADGGVRERNVRAGADRSRLVSLNGITVSKFSRIIRQRSWSLNGLPATLPLLEELFLDRICVDLEKVDRPASCAA